MYHRIIPRLDIKGPNLVKGIHLEGLRVLGRPEEFAGYYYEAGADELIYQDVVASLYERNSLHEIIKRTAKEIFIPLTVGGGLRTIQDIAGVLKAGADKVVINTAAINRSGFIKSATREFGSSTIVVAIEAIKQPDNKYLAHTDNGRNQTENEVVRWAQNVEELGAGEILITSVDKDGTGEGFDIDIVKTVSDSVSIPVIAHGGAGCISHVEEVIEHGHADAVAIASMLHYRAISDLPDNSYAEEEGNRIFLNSKRTFSKIETLTLQDIKQGLISRRIKCRN